MQPQNQPKQSFLRWLFSSEQLPVNSAQRLQEDKQKRFLNYVFSWEKLPKDFPNSKNKHT